MGHTPLLSTLPEIDTKFLSLRTAIIIILLNGKSEPADSGSCNAEPDPEERDFQADFVKNLIVDYRSDFNDEMQLLESDILKWEMASEYPLSGV